jgi:leader peptidase (prepilin peptidase)/N-methyltransferase
MEPAATRLLATVASGVFGLLIGSFLNVVVYRLPRAMSIARPPSHCPACDTQLSALDNIPVLSWLALRGRCRHCGAAISPRYPVVELATGVLFAGLALALPSVKPIAPLAGVVAATIAVAAIDVDNLRVPPVLGWFAAASATSLIAVSTAGHVPGRLGWAGVGAGTAVAAWLLHRGLDRVGDGPRRFPDIALCAAWGWAAGWLALGGGLAIGIALVVLALATPLRRFAQTRGVIAFAATLSVATIVAGAIATR